MILIVCIQGNLENFKGNFFPNKKYVTIGVIQVKVKSFVKIQSIKSMTRCIYI